MNGPRCLGVPLIQSEFKGFHPGTRSFAGAYPWCFCNGGVNSGVPGFSAPETGRRKSTVVDSLFALTPAPETGIGCTGGTPKPEARRLPSSALLLRQGNNRGRGPSRPMLLGWPRPEFPRWQPRRPPAGIPDPPASGAARRRGGRALPLPAPTATLRHSDPLTTVGRRTAAR